MGTEPIHGVNYFGARRDLRALGEGFDGHFWPALPAQDAPRARIASNCLFAMTKLSAIYCVLASIRAYARTIATLRKLAPGPAIN